jgi:hypothetical protein
LDRFLSDRNTRIPPRKDERLREPVLRSIDIGKPG